MTTNAVLAGAAAGFAATTPMTIVMELLHDHLPTHERYPLPPGEIVADAERKAGVAPPGGVHRALALAAHFGYGAAAGSLYGPLTAGLPAAPLVRGALFGLGVWGASYLGLLPALGVLRPATQHPARRSALMIAAHLVWGAALAATAERLTEEGST